MSPGQSEGNPRPTRSPHLDIESDLFGEGHRWIAGVDEVGRGSAFGPCCVGVALIDEACAPFPRGLRDSKLLTPASRLALIEPLRKWVTEYAVGEASAREIDDYGLVAALRLAGLRALSTLTRRADVILLDGSHNWLQRGKPSLIAPIYPDVALPEVRTRVKADLTCASVAAASVFAKVHRDQLVVDLARRVPGYDLENNKGYFTPAHIAALRELGPSDFHRVSWRLPPRDDTHCSEGSQLP